MIEAGKAFPTVLVVDDYADTRMVFRRLMEARGCVVAEATDGEQAIRAAAKIRPDLVLLDLNMPHLDGLETAQKMREMSMVRDSVAIIAVTAFHTYGMREAALEAGCDDYLTKPLDLNELDRTLRQLLPLWF
jgi:CheY-like chemotaxis protein